MRSDFFLHEGDVFDLLQYFFGILYVVSSLSNHWVEQIIQHLVNAVRSTPCVVDNGSIQCVFLVPEHFGDGIKMGNRLSMWRDLHNIILLVCDFHGILQSIQL